MTTLPTDATATALPLEYAAQSAVGDVTLTRVDGVTTVTRRPSWGRVLEALWPVVAVAVPVLAVLSVPLFRNPIPGPLLAVFGLLAASLGVGASLPGLILACHPIRWEVSPTGIVLTARRATRVIHEHYPATTVVDVRVERVRLNTQIVKRSGLVTVNPVGGLLLHARASRAELALMAQAFRDGLGLGPDPLGIAEYPTRPRWSVTDRRIGRDADVVTVNSARLPLDAVVAPAILAGVFVVATALVHGLGPAGGSWSAALAVGGATVAGAALPGAGGLLLLYRLRRRVTIEMSATGVTLSEASLVRPGREAWPSARIVGPLLSIRPGGRRADLSLQLTDAPPAVLIANGPARDVRYVHDGLAVALGRRRGQPQPQP